MTEEAKLAATKKIKLAANRAPVTEQHVSIGGTIVLFPSEAAQRAGFTPITYASKGEKEVAVDASKLILDNFAGIYLPFVEKGK